MPNKARLYIGVIIGLGIAALAASIPGSKWPDALPYATFLVLTAVFSAIKLRLPGLTGTYSLNAIFLLYALLNFDAGPALAAACLSALAQSLINTTKRPTAVQIAFNTANLCLSLFASIAAFEFLVAHGLGAYRPAALALAAALYFVLNTGIVSGILSLLQGRNLADVCEEWYVWSFVYYAIGVAVIGGLPSRGDSASVVSWLIIAPLLFLLHFYVGLSRVRKASDEGDETQGSIPPGARPFFVTVLAVGAGVLAWSLRDWHSENITRFACYVCLAVAASVWKVRLPRLTGTISAGFVVVLAAVASLSLAEAVAISAAVGVVQCLWGAARRVTALQLSFNLAVQMIGAALAFAVTRIWLTESPAPLLFVLMAMMMYGTTSLLVSGALCAVQGKPLLFIWRSCYFWTLPYYMVGATAAGLMITADRAAGWPAAASVLPAMMLVHVSYRAHVTRNTKPVVAAVA